MTSNTSSILTKGLPITKQLSKKRSIQDDVILKKPIVCLDKVTNEEPEDGLTIFGRYIASELREINFPIYKGGPPPNTANYIFSPKFQHNIQIIPISK